MYKPICRYIALSFAALFGKLRTDHCYKGRCGQCSLLPKSESI